MTELAEHRAARLLGVDVDADAALIRHRFRLLVRSVHPDTAAATACVDLGRLAEAKDLLLARAERRSVARAAADRAERASTAAAQQAQREDEARRRVEAMRLADQPGARSVFSPDPEPVRAGASVFAAAAPPRLSRHRFGVADDHLGRYIDLAG